MSEAGGGRKGRGPAPEAVNGSQNGANASMLPSDPVELERLIDDRRQRLAVTVDELARQTRPTALARRTAQDVGTRFRTACYTDDGRLRVERVAAVVTAIVVPLALLVRWRRSR